MANLRKEIWLGALLGNNRASLIERCAQLVSERRSERFVYLAASQPLLEVVTEGILDGSTNHGLWGELPVYLFRGFVRHIIATVVDAETSSLLPPRVPIDREELPLKRSLISQILQQLKARGRLNAIAPLVNSDGCVNTIATLIGEIQRAGKTPDELEQILSQRSTESELSNRSTEEARSTFSQADFDREVALVYSTYSSLLQENNLTEDDANGLRALSILNGELDGKSVALPWLEKAELLILDGFFDFTPVQGEMLRSLIPHFPQVIVNLNKDERNPDIFKPFDETIERLQSIAQFEIKHSSNTAPVLGALAPLRETLFNPSHAIEPTETDSVEQNEIRYWDCTDRETEIRAIAKQIKRLVLLEQYKLSEIGLVVRERESYAETIARVMREEAIPCNLDRRVIAGEIPAARAVLKLLAILDELARDKSNALKMPQLADQIKSGYFRLPFDDIETLGQQFAANYSNLLRNGVPLDPDREERKKRELGIGRWDADALENAIAYVGAELRMTDWLERCKKLIRELPGAPATKELLNIDSAEASNDDEEAQLEGAETLQKEDRGEKKRRPQTDVNPAALAWASLVIKRFAGLIQAVPHEGTPVELRAALMKLLGQLEFRGQVTRPVRSADAHHLPRVTLDLHALEALRRAMVTTIKSIQFTQQPDSTSVRLTTFIEEMRRCLHSQTVTLRNAERGGLRVLEATNVRGLRFRAIFVAGLVEGGFPLSASRDWIYPHEERERLKKYGLVLEDISPATLLKEEHYFYQVACRATERLYLSRPLLLEGDNETVASYYIEELRRAISPAVILREEVVRTDLDGKKLEDTSSPRELAIGLVRQQQQHFDRRPQTFGRPLPQISRFLSLARNDRLLSDAALHRIGIERERSSDRFGPHDGQITNPELVALIKRKFGPDFVHSASGLSTFGNCPYRFFAQRVLKLEPRGEAALDLQALDAGKLLHDILRRFFERHRGERFDPDDQAELSVELLTIADEVFDQHERIVPPLNRQIWRLDRAIRKIILEQVLLFELDIQQKSEALEPAPARFELAFGGTQSVAKDPDSTDQPLQITRSTFVGEETIKIGGQIDRVDVTPNNLVVAYDYKLSKGATPEDMRQGRSLQIPIYLEALEQLFFPDQQIAGGGYYTLRGGVDRRNTGMYRALYSKELGLKAKTSVMGEPQWNQFRAAVITRIWGFLDRMREGSFTVEPSEGFKSCRFCDYVAVCRYEKYRIERKKRSRIDNNRDSEA